MNTVVVRFYIHALILAIVLVLFIRVTISKVRHVLSHSHRLLEGDSQESRVKQIPLWKKIVFSALITVCCFVFFEITLAVIGVHPYLSIEDPFLGFSGSKQLFVEQTQADGSTIMTTASYKSDYFNKQNFSKIKGPNTFRIFCLGGSTTYGRPYTDRMSFSGWLRAFLPVADPSRNWEVINAGGISYASYRVAELMKELSQYEPDLFIIYSGQNEFLEERTYQEIKKTPEFIVDLTEILGSTRIYSAMKYIIDKAVPSSSSQAQKKYQMTGEVKEILNQSVGPTSYTRENLHENDVIYHYEINHQRMVAVARSVGAGIMFVTPVVNLKDMSPFKSQNDAGLTNAKRERWEKLYENGKDLLQAGKYGEAVNAFQEALSIDIHHAELNYRLGQAFFTLGQFDEAKESFQRAVDEDICPLRIMSPMRSDLQSVTEKMGVPLVDFQSTLETIYARDYGHTIFGGEYFLDHVHLTYQGYRLLALDILDELERQGTVKPTSAWNDGVIAAVTKMKEAQLDSKMIAEALLNLGKVMDWAGRLEEAHNLFLRSYNLYEDKEALMHLGVTASRMGMPAESIGYFEKVLQTNPDYPNAQYALATLYKDLGQVEKALKHYKKCVEIMPDNAKFHYELGELLRDSNENGPALYHLKEVVKIEPDTLKGRRSQAIIYQLTGQIDKAVNEFENLLKINPDLIKIHNDLGILFASIGEIEKAEQYFRKEIQLNPASGAAKRNLATALKQQGKPPESDLNIIKSQ